MTYLFKKTVIISWLISLLIICNLASADTTQSDKNTRSLLLVLSAKSGTITQSAQGYKLTLNNIDPRILWFTDRPNRTAGFMPLTTFLKGWPQGFNHDAPNAALIHASAAIKIKGETQPMAMELSQPDYQNNTLTFKVSTLKGDKVMSGKFDDISLFFDKVVAYCSDPTFACACHGTCF